MGFLEGSFISYTVMEPGTRKSEFWYLVLYCTVVIVDVVWMCVMASMDAYFSVWSELGLMDTILALIRASNLYPQ